MKKIQEEKKTYLLIESEKDLDEVLSLLDEELAEDNATEVAFDIETNGVEEHLVETIGIAFTWFLEGGIYLPLFEWNTETEQLDPLFSNRTRKKLVEKLCNHLAQYDLIMHNGVFDVACIYHCYGINLKDSLYCDTMLQKHTIDEERPFGLKDIGAMLFGEEAVEEQNDLEEAVKAAGGKWLKKRKDMYMAPKDILGKYAVKDVILTLSVYDEYSQELERQDLERFFYKKEVMPLNRAATIPMKLHGLYCDVEYFESLKKQIQDDIIRLTDEVFELIEDDIEPKVREILDKEIRTSRTGKFAEGVLRHYDLPVPLNKKTGKPTLAKSALQSLDADYPEHPALEWLLWDSKSGKKEPKLPEEVVYNIKREIYAERKPEYPRVFNLGSTHHLSWLIYDVYGEEPHKRSKKTGKPTVDKDSLEEFDLPFIPKLAQLKKLEKLLSTYINPILEKQTDGWLYPSMQQWGTTSGRYSCGGGLNFQTLPRFERPKKCPKCDSKNAKIENESLMEIKIECDNCGLQDVMMDLAMIKRGFIAPKGYKIVAADFSSLEPRIFSWVSDDPGLKEVYWKNLDLYSKIAIDVFGLTGVSADKKDENFLKKMQPEMRRLSKVFCFTESTMVHLEDKGYRSIKDVEENDWIYTSKSLSRVLNTFKRKSKVVEFITNKGGFKCTPDHKIWSVTRGDWVEAQNFKEDEEVHIEFGEANSECDYSELQYLPVYSNASFKNGAKEPLSYLKFDEDWAWLLGAYLGDGVGSYTRRKDRDKRMMNSHLISSYVGICGLEEDEVTLKFQRILKERGYKLTSKVRKREGQSDFCINTVPDFELVKIFQDTFKAFSQNGKDGKKNLKVQDFVLNSYLPQKLAFIAGLLDTDGYLKANESKNYSDVSIVSKEWDLISGLANVLRSINVDFGVSLDWNKTYKRYYYILRIHQKGIYDLAKMGITKYMACERKREAFKYRLKKTPLERKTTTNKVLKILDKGEEDYVYDITVDKDHEFLANGIRVHNCLAVPYGAGAGRIAGIMKKDFEEAQGIIDAYLDAYPNLRNYMATQEEDAYKTGMVATRFGRVRHLPRAKELFEEYGKRLFNKKRLLKKILLDEDLSKEEAKTKANEIYYEFRNYMNNAKNFPIQATAAHVTNAALIYLDELFCDNEIEGWICLQVHDEIICIVKENQAEEASELLRESMENNWVSKEIDIDMIAEPEIADNFADAK